mgnify:FL=1
MNFKFKKLGNIDNGNVEVGDLTVICGPNNVGKTYISYAIYGFIRYFRRLIDLQLSSETISELRQEGTVEINLQFYSENISLYIDQASKEFSSDLDDYFNTTDDFFGESQIALELKDFKFNFEDEYKSIVQFGKKESLIFNKEKEDIHLTVTLQTDDESKNLRVPNSILNSVISNQIAEYLFRSVLPRPFVITSERTGISLFYKELDISKNAILEHITASEKVNPIELINVMRSRYAQPIQDNITTIRDYDNILKRKSFIKSDQQKYKYILDSLSNMLGGSYKSIDKQVVFVPKKERNRDKVNVPVYIASSSIKSLFLIDMYVNYLAEPNGLLIIDEPELNLHPDNQRKMAGLLASLVNSGIKILITTHSDYLIRELNNRIMLSSNFKNKNAILKEEYIDSHEILRPEQVKAYSLTGDHKINSIEVGLYGMNMEIFDCLIEKANRLSENIFYGMENLRD